jgi:hypothetical protein
VTADKAAITALLLADKAAKKYSPKFFFFSESVAGRFAANRPDTTALKGGARSAPTTF